MTLRLLPDESDKVAIPGNLGALVTGILLLLHLAGVEVPDWLTQEWALLAVAVGIGATTQIGRVAAWFRSETNPAPSAVATIRRTGET